MTDQVPPAAASQSWRTVAVVALAALALLLVVLGITVGLLLGDDDDGDDDNSAGDPPSTAASSPTASDSSTADETPSPENSEPTAPAEFAEVVDVASQFMTVINTYGPTMLEADGTMPTYRFTVSQLLTSKFLAEFNDTVPTVEATVKDAGLSRTATIGGSGLSSVDDDAATALVSGTIVNSYPKNADDPDGPRVDGESTAFRVTITLQQTDGTWLVDGFVPVEGAAQDDAAGLGAELEAPRTAAAEALEVILAYDYREMDAETARPLLTDAYWVTYNKLFEVLAQNAPDQQAVVTARALATAVTDVGDGYVDVLVFVDRQSTTTNGDQQYDDAVTARMVASPDGWLVDKISTAPGE